MRITSGGSSMRFVVTNVDGGTHPGHRAASEFLVLTALILALFCPTAGAQGTGYWHTSGNKILDSNGDEVRMAGINWYGFETPDYIVHGLWAQDYHTVLNTIKSLGYNVIRIPFSNQMVESDPVPTNFTTFANGETVNQALDGQTALADLDTIVAYAGSIGLRVILDNHRSEAGESNEANGLWYTSAYPQANWIADWQTMATRYSASKFTFNGNPTVIGVDLRNEPHLSGSGSTTGSCWTGDTATNGCPTSLSTQNWPVAAEAAGNAVLAINPKLLIFVEGNDCYSGVCGWQGGNLIGVASNPVTLSVANQLVYSAHDYGPNLFQQAWFNSSTTPASLDAIWNKYWAYISANGTAPVWLGEFGTDNTSTDIESTAAGSQGQWFESLVSFLQNNPTINWTYWALNGEDSYDLLDGNYDATPVSSLKQSELASIQFPLGGTLSPSFTLTDSASSLSIAQGSSGTDIISVVDAGGFTGSVTLAASGLPSGVTATFATNATTGSTVLTLAASASAPQGSATITITGTSGALTAATTTIALTIGPSNTGGFTLSAAAPSLTILQGASGTDTISVTDLNGFAGNVTLTASGLPSGVTAAFGTNPTTGSSLLTLTASGAAVAGTSTVTITGSSGGLTATTAIALTVSGTGGGFACHIGYTISSQWGGGFGAAITINNTGTTAISNWTLTWTFANGQTITQLWNGSETQSGANVTVNNLSYNGSIPAGGSYTAMGFNGTWNNTTNAVPTSFAVNGTACK
jgi:endoglucanase